MTKLTANGKALLVTMMFRFLFEGYLVAKDQYAYDDAESALTVLLMTVLLGVFTALFLFGKRYGLTGIISLSILLAILQTVFIVLALGHITDAGMHDPGANLWATVLRYLFLLLTLVFSIRVYRESQANLQRD
jgi:hypothetical protein